MILETSYIYIYILIKLCFYLYILHIYSYFTYMIITSYGVKKCYQHPFGTTTIS